MGSAFNTAAFFRIMLISVLLVCSIPKAGMHCTGHFLRQSRQLLAGSFSDSDWTLQISPSGDPPGDELPYGFNDDLARGAHPEGLKLPVGEELIELLMAAGQHFACLARLHD